MIVITDRSPINYPILIKEIDILPKMYGCVVFPQTVREELCGRRHHSWFDLGSIICQSGSRFGALLLSRTHRWQSSVQWSAMRSRSQRNYT